MTRRSRFAKEERARLELRESYDANRRNLDRFYQLARWSKNHVELPGDRWKDHAYVSASLAKLESDIFRRGTTCKPSLLTIDGKKWAAAIVAAVTGVSIRTAWRYVLGELRTGNMAELTWSPPSHFVWLDFAGQQVRLKKDRVRKD